MPDGQTVVGGRYQLQEPLGRGGMAEVHLALDLRLDRQVAVKLLSANLAADPTAQTRFRREAQAAAKLNDPTIASVFDTGEDTDPATGISIPYIVMELVEGSTLRAVLGDGVPLDPDRALTITQSVLDALAHSHDAGLIHRDIKPANVMITPTGGVKVMDFGIARAVDDTSTSLTQTAAVIGTAQYLSPEQASGKSVDIRTDLYSVGCLLFELLVGRAPFVGETSISVAYQHVREPPVPPSSLNPALSPDIDAVVLKALAKDPADRYQSAREMKADLARLVAGDEGFLPAPAAGDATVAVTAPGPVTALPVAAAVPAAAVPTTQSLPAAAASAVAVPPVTDLPVEGDEGQGRSRRVLLVAAALLLVLGLGAFGLFRLLDPGSASAASVVVPSVVGSTRADAEVELRSSDLVAEFRDVHGADDDTVGTVTKQTPLGGDELAPGSTVTAEVNVGPATATIPDDLVGEDVDKVKKELEKAGFTNVQAEPVEATSDDVKREEVVSVEPGEGDSAALDETIVVRYAAEEGDSSETATSEPESTDQPPEPEESDDSSEPEETESADPTESQSRPTADPTESSAPSPKGSASTTTTRAAKPRTSSKPEKPPKTNNPQDPKTSEAAQEVTQPR